ncbi:MAG: exonuclease domain-containing protein [Elusimicrobia bacterium]|nr:exonuclease domain-containing protein [Elusimicrobiota bacterium]
MRLNHDLLVLDLEATSNQSTAAERPAVQTNNYIIEIGAALLDRELKLVDTFQRLVRPEEPITPFITEITSITPEMCADQPLWKDVAPEFEAWVALRCGNVKRARLAAWGTYFDIPLLRRVYARYGRPFPFPGTSVDVKTLALLWAALSGRRTDKLGVDAVAAAMGIRPEGRYHRALTDATTEARILQRVCADLENGFFAPGPPGKPRPYFRVEKAA